ncbi:MAG: fused MFS/spermidine synthase [Thaumarchaeota archaeon]|nr:fused MFS/spermidine synthase [Nitrososphaerota archaeon]
MNKKLLLIIFGLTGMTALIYEIIWIRPLSLVFGTTIYAVSTIIASFILGLAIGSWLAGKYTDRLKNPLRYFAFTQLGVGFYGILLLPIFGALPEIYLGLYHATFPNQSFFMFTQILMSIAMISIPAILMGTTLPLMMRTYSEEFTTIGKDVGKLDASNSFGAVIGTLAAGFLLIPILGIQNSIIVTASINIIIAIAILSTKKYLKPKYLAIIIVIVIPLFVLYPGYDVTPLQTGIYSYVDPSLTIEEYKTTVESQDLLFYKESLYQSVMVTSFEDSERLRLNGKIQCSMDPFTQEGLIRLGFFPYNLFEHNYGTPQTALNVGLGCGITSKALSEHLETTTIEIDPVVVEANEFFYDDIDHRLIIDDARNWLLRNDEKFDIIITEPSDPYQNNGLLFTKEYFSLLSNRLTENGLVSQWVPAFELEEKNFMIFYNTFHSVFPYVYIYQMEPNEIGQLIFIGSQKPIEITDKELYLVNQDDIVETETELNTDDKPIIEFSTALSLYSPKSDRIIKMPLKDIDMNELLR